MSLPPFTPQLALGLAAALAYGFGVGTVYLLALRLNARLYLESGPLWRPIGLMLARLIGSVALLGALVPWGWEPTLAALAGFALARALVTRRIGGAPGGLEP